MTRPKTIARIDLGVAICLAALSLFLIYAADSAAADAVRKYGRNVDSGALEWMAAVLYVAPLALLFGFASLALWRQWRIARYAHWLAIAALVALPFVDYVSIF
jgi:cell division protein FtsW (lipid II flippase)